MTLKNDFIVSIDGLGNWEKFSGGEATASAVKYFPGGAVKPVQVGGVTNYSDITIERTWNGKTDQALLHKLRAAVGLGLYQIQKKAVDARKRTISGVNAEVWPNCLLTGVTAPETENGSEDLGVLSLTFSTTGPNLA